MYDYEGLNQKLLERGLKKSELTSILKISSRTIAKIAKGEKLADQVMDKLCGYFSCNKADLCHTVSPNPVLQRLREEKEHRIPGGLYHELQIRMTYNSNHIEGSTLSEEQTRRIFETNTLGAEDDLVVDDIIETVNHFRAIDYCIEVAEEALSEDIIKHLHYLLKMRTQAERLVWFQIGDYKQRPNVVGGTKTSTPKEVPAAMKALITAYLAKENVSLADIVEFHYRFEKIHPFQDGNGRVGRLIAFKECLKQNLVPFIIEDRKKYYYYRGLKEYESQPGFLLDTCLDGQDTFRALLELFEVETPPNSLK
ncbi:Fic family protein [Varibaculum timonense]|uniref:Fic family protein n=1 Tax=Varibaculum timonense TaxID=1964383 RepID=UPI0022E03DDE|nr:Fic family protein [Varibaculum timonense]